jgi:hypothetical protein
MSRRQRSVRPTTWRNLRRLRGSVQGHSHLRNLDRWQRLIRDRDVPGLRRVTTGLDTDSVEMHEVSPMGGLLSQEDRSQVLDVAPQDDVATPRCGQIR